MTLENGSVYTLSYCCHPHSESVKCSCDCHDENSAAKENLNKYHVNIVDGDYVFEADLKLASSEPHTPNVVASTRKSAALSYDKIKELMDRYPLGLRPYFEAQRIRQVNREARSVINVMHGIVDDFYLNLLDWGKLGIIALGSSQNVVLINSADPEAWPITQLNSGNEERPEPENLCTSLKWSPEGDKLAVGIRNGNVQIWDLETRVKVRELNAHMQRVSVIDWAPIDQILTTASRDKSILIHDLRNPDSRAVVATFSRHKQEICGLKWRDPNLHSVDEIRQQSPPDENTPTEESGDQESNVDDDGTRISNLFEDELRRTFSTPARNVSQTKAMAIKTLNSVLNQSSCDATDTMASTFVPGSKPILASGGNDNKVFIWELGYETPIMRLSVHSAAVKALAWAPLSKPVLATGGGTNDRTVRLWDLSCKRELAAYETESQVCNLFWSHATMEIVSTHGYTLNQVNVWDLCKQPGSQTSTAHRLLTFRKLATLTGHTARVLFLGSSPDGTQICTAAADGNVRIWTPFIDFF